MGDKIEALLRGLGQGFSRKYADELAPEITRQFEEWFGGPVDPMGMRRTYAQSPFAEQTEQARRENAEARDTYPLNYLGGQALSELPASVAAGAAGLGGPLAAQIAKQGLIGGLMGAIGGSGGAEEGGRLKGAANAAGPSALLSMAGAAAPAAAGAVKDLFKGGGPPAGGSLAPAVAGAGRSGARAAAGKASTGPGIGINMSKGDDPRSKATVPPPGRAPKAKAEPASEPLPESERNRMLPPKVEHLGEDIKVPRAGKPKMSGKEAEELAELYDQEHGKKVLDELTPSKHLTPEEAPWPKPAEVPAEFRAKDYKWGQGQESIERKAWDPDEIRASDKADRARIASNQEAINKARGVTDEDLEKLYKPRADYDEERWLAGRKGRLEKKQARKKEARERERAQREYQPEYTAPVYGKHALRSELPGLKSPSKSTAEEFKLDSWGEFPLTVQQTNKTPTGVEQAQVSIKPGRDSIGADIEELMRLVRDDN